MYREKPFCKRVIGSLKWSSLIRVKIEIYANLLQPLLLRLFCIFLKLLEKNLIIFYFFTELYKLTGEILGEGAYASVQTCINLFTDVECAVKIIDKIPGHARARVFREVETFHHCQGHPNILQLIEFFEDKEKFYLVFEKINGGPLLTRIQENICFSEHDAAQIIKEIASGLNFLHKKGIAHRDLKVIIF